MGTKMTETMCKRVALTLSCQPGRSAQACAVTFLAGLLTLPALAGPVNWAHQAGTVQGNGAVVVKSLSGASYAGTSNPSGAIAKLNQNASTQPPTVIIQATGGGTQFALTDATFNGNLGGKSGGDEKCANEFGNGWKFATRGQILNVLPNFTHVPFWTYSATSCSGFTSNSAGQYGGYWNIAVNSGAQYWGLNSSQCNYGYALLCVSM